MLNIKVLELVVDNSLLLYKKSKDETFLKILDDIFDIKYKYYTHFMKINENDGINDVNEMTVENEHLFDFKKSSSTSKLYAIDKLIYDIKDKSFKKIQCNINVEALNTYSNIFKYNYDTLLNNRNCLNFLYKLLTHFASDYIPLFHCINFHIFF